MMSSRKIVQQLELTQKQKDLQEKYQGYIKQQIDQGIVDPLKVFCFLFKKYCDDGYNIAYLFHTRNHVNFFKDIEITNMLQLLMHLNNYWGHNKIETDTEFYAMCFSFFYYYGLPPGEYQHLQPLASIIQECINTELEQMIKKDKFFGVESYFSEENLNKMFLLNIPEELLEKLITIIHERFKEKSNERIFNYIYVDFYHRVLKQSPIKSKFLKILQQIHDKDKNCSCCLGMLQEPLLELEEIEVLEEKLTNKILRPISPINILIEELDGNDENRLQLCLDELCHSSIPAELQKPIIDKLFALCERKKYTNIKVSSFEVLWRVNFNTQSREIIIDKLIEYINNQYHSTTFLDEALETLLKIDLSRYPAERLAKSMVTWPLIQMSKIIHKFKVPESYQYHIMKLLINNIYIYPQTIIAFFKRLSAGQQIIWLNKLKDLYAESYRSIYHYIYLMTRFEYYSAKYTIIQELNDCSEMIVENEIEKIDIEFKRRHAKDINTIINNPLEKKYPQIIDHLFAHVVAEGNVDLVKLLLQRKPNLNYIYNNRSLLFALPDSGSGCQIAELLISHGTDVDLMNPLLHYVSLCNFSVVRLLLSKCPTIKLGDSFHKACEMGNVELINIFIAHGVNVRMLDSKGDTPLMSFIRNKYHYIWNFTESGRYGEALILLLNKGAWDYQVCVKAMEKKVSGERHNLLTKLIEYMPSEQEQRQAMLNDLLTKCDWERTAELLVKSGADIRLAKLEFILSSAELTTKIINIIKENIKNKQPWHASLKHINFMETVYDNCCSGIISILNVLPGGINFQDDQGKTILHYVCENKQITQFSERVNKGRLFVRAGASLFVKDNLNKLPEDYLYSNELANHNESSNYEAKNIYLTNNNFAREIRYKWQEIFALDYQEQLLFHTMLCFAKVFLSPANTCLSPQFPLDVFNIILKCIAPEDRRFCDIKNVGMKFERVLASVRTIFHQRKVVQLLSPPPLQEVSLASKVQSVHETEQNRMR